MDEFKLLSCISGFLLTGLYPEDKQQSTPRVTERTLTPFLRENPVWGHLQSVQKLSKSVEGAAGLEVGPALCPPGLGAYRTSSYTTISGLTPGLCIPFTYLTKSKHFTEKVEATS